MLQHDDRMRLSPQVAAAIAMAVSLSTHEGPEAEWIAWGWRLLEDFRELLVKGLAKDDWTGWDRFESIWEPYLSDKNIGAEWLPVEATKERMAA